MADRVVGMNAGRIEQIGQVEDLYLRSDSLVVAGSFELNLRVIDANPVVIGKLCRHSMIGSLSLLSGLPSVYSLIQPTRRKRAHT